MGLISFCFFLFLGILPGGAADAAERGAGKAGPAKTAPGGGVAESKDTREDRPDRPREERRDIHIYKLKAIHIPATPNSAENDMARMLQRRLEALSLVEHPQWIHGIRLQIKRGLPHNDEPAILLGPQLGVASGMVTEGELSAMKYDGYVIKGSANRIVLSGYAPQGTIYASYAFLRKIGLKIYPWHHGGGLEVFTPPANGMLKPFSVSSKPFFEHRDVLSPRDKGRFGGTIRRYSLGDLRFAQEQKDFKDGGWLGWDHTAGYLVPLRRYRDDHPEYFAMRRGLPTSKSLRTLRVNICMCNPGVPGISSKRAVEWMGIQKGRRYFAVTDGDSTKGRCPQCAATDPIPDYYTDRLLKWVNTVARSVAGTYPENVPFTLAYGRSAKPPLETGLEPNVLVVYAPSYWTSRTTSAVGFAHPLNVTAMEEFMGWSMLFPNQMGIYDYPQNWVYGAAKRIKFFAKNKVRWIYQNGARGSLFHWVSSRLLWDPFLDSEKLESEFVRAFYGPAAGVMKEYLRLRRETIEANSLHTRSVFRNAVFLRKARMLLGRAEQIAEGADPRTQTRILEGVIEGLHTSLLTSLWNALPPQDDPKVLRDDFERYVKLHQRVLDNGKHLNFTRGMLRSRKNIFIGRLKNLGIRLPGRDKKDNAHAGQRDIFETAMSGFDDLLKTTTVRKELFPTGPGQSVRIAFASPGEQKNWRVYGSRVNLVSPPVSVTLNGPWGGPRRGVRVSAPLARLPVVARGNIQVHAGRFYAERVFDPPLDVDGRFFLDFRIKASRDVPVTIYINKTDRLRSDVDLHAGEQIVRIDLRNYSGTRFDYRNWDRKIRSIAFDIWPQDNFYPYPEAQDTELTFLGLEAKNHDPEPGMLPHKNKAIWMTHFRPNVPRGTRVIREVANAYKNLVKRLGSDTAIESDYVSRRINEKFRTFTEHRTVSPIVAILTGKQSSAAVERAAATIQRYLKKMYSVELPINPKGLSAGPHIGNVIVLGTEAGLATGQIKPNELRHVGPDGFVIRARNGRIVIAGADDQGTLFGVARFLEDHGARFAVPGVRETIPDRRNGFLHELYLLDWPYFTKRPIPCGALLMTQSPKKEWKGTGALPGKGSALAEKVASAIKGHARRGRNAVPENVVSGATKSALSCYVAAKLLWNPFADTTRLIRDFGEATRTAPPG